MDSACISVVYRGPITGGDADCMTVDTQLAAPRTVPWPIQSALHPQGPSPCAVAPPGASARPAPAPAAAPTATLAVTAAAAPLASTARGPGASNTVNLLSNGESDFLRGHRLFHDLIQIII